MPGARWSIDELPATGMVTAFFLGGGCCISRLLSRKHPWKYPDNIYNLIKKYQSKAKNQKKHRTPEETWGRRVG